jgi:hypothetical protein
LGHGIGGVVAERLVGDGVAAVANVILLADLPLSDLKSYPHIASISTSPFQNPSAQ